MSNVTLQIAGRSYTVACAKGEERHIQTLGETIDAKLAALPAMAGQSEQRTLLFAALLLADELHDTRRRLDEASARPADPPAHAESGPKLLEPLENLAERLETLASRLEGARTSS